MSTLKLLVQYGNEFDSSLPEVFEKIGFNRVLYVWTRSPWTDCRNVMKEASNSYRQEFYDMLEMNNFIYMNHIDWLPK